MLYGCMIKYIQINNLWSGTMKKFNQRIIQLYQNLIDLHVRKFGRKDFAAYLGVSIGKANGWIDGTGSPDYDTLIEISKKTGISPLWFIGASDDMYPVAAKDIGLPTEAEAEYKQLVQYLKFKYRVKIIEENNQNKKTSSRTFS